MSRGNKRVQDHECGEKPRYSPPRDLGSGSLRRQGFSGVWQRGVLDLLLTRGVLVVSLVGERSRWEIEREVLFGRRRAVELEIEEWVFIW